MSNSVFVNRIKAYPDFYTNPESFIVTNSSQTQYQPQKPVVVQTYPQQLQSQNKQQNSGNSKLFLGFAALAGLTALGILGHKGYLGDDIQKLLGGVKKTKKTTEPKPKTDTEPKKNIDPEPEIKVNPEPEIKVDPEPKVKPKTEEPKVNQEPIMGNIEVKGKKIQAVVKLGSKELERYNAIADELKNFTLPEEIVKIYDEYSVKNIEELKKLEIGKHDSRRVIDKYPSGKSKYEININNKDLYMLDEETQNSIKILNENCYFELDPKHPIRYTKHASINEDKSIKYVSQNIAWNKNNEEIEEVFVYPSDNSAHNTLWRNIYDKDGNKLYYLTYQLPSGKFW